MATPGHPTRRLRLSVWADRNFIKPETVKEGKDIIDDISLIRLIQHKETTFADITLKPLSNGQKIQCRDIIEACHSQNIQVLIGYAFSPAQQPNESQRFNAWLKQLAATSDPEKRNKEINRFATQFIELVNQDFQGRWFDGISFDIESIHDRDKASEMGDVLVEFIQAVNDGMALSPVVERNPILKNRIVGVAAGGIVAQPPHFNNFLAHFQPPGLRTPSTPVVTGLTAHPNAIAHKYKMATNRTTLIVRPMAYDNFDVVTKKDPRNFPRKATPEELATRRQDKNKPFITQWHRDMVDYALSEGISEGKGANLIASQFQLGIKTFEGVSNRPTSDKFVNIDGIMDDETEVRRRCIELRKRGVGLIIFAFPRNDPTRFWKKVKTYNYALNSIKPVSEDFATNPGSDKNFNPSDAAQNTLKPSIKSQPLQVPHDEMSLKRLKEN